MPSSACKKKTIQPSPPPCRGLPDLKSCQQPPPDPPPGSPPRPHRPAPLFFFNATATTEIYTLSLHDALPITDPIAAQQIAAERVAVNSGPAGRRRSLL